MRPFIGITTPFITARVPYIYRLLWVHQRYDTDWYGINIAHAKSRLEGLNTVFIQYCMCLSDANCKFEKKKSANGPQAFLLCSCCRPFHWRSHVKGHSCHHPPTLRRGKTHWFFCDQLGLKSLQVCGRAGFVYRLGVFVSLTQTKSAFSCFSIFQFSVSKNCESECHWCFFQRTKMGSYYLFACSPNVHQQASC